MRQILTNLVDNAVKYSPDGGKITLRLGHDDACVRFAVTDQGLGVPAQEHGRIFEKFYRLDPELTRGVGGTGLGLYISRELVRRMNGRIHVESDGGRRARPSRSSFPSRADVPKKGGREGRPSRVVQSAPA